VSRLNEVEQVHNSAHKPTTNSMGSRQDGA
jgi:hypothetical protein